MGIPYCRPAGGLKRKVREAIKIKTIQPTINRDQEIDLPVIYRGILPFTRDRIKIVGSSM